MDGVKWIKITTNMFNDERIKLIESMPEKDTLLIIWIKLLIQAGKTNHDGYIYLNENIPYTDEMLSTIFNRPLTTVRMALQTFKQFGMVEIDDNQFISITNWEKHQNTEKLSKIREQTKERVARHREKKRLEQGKSSNALQGVTGNAHKNKIKNKNKEYMSGKPDEGKPIPFKQIIEHLNVSAASSYKHTAASNQDLIKARWNEGYNLEDFITVIDHKAKEWIGNNEMEAYLRPKTLFAKGHFDEYLNQAKKALRKKQNQPKRAYDNGDDFLNKLDQIEQAVKGQ